MDGSTPKRVKDRAFEPSKIPFGDPAKRLVEQCVERVAQLERRERARKKEDQERHLRMCAALVLDLTHREISEPGEWLFVSMQNDQYGTKNRAAWFLTERFPVLIKVLKQDRALIDYVQGERGAFGTGQRTKIRAGSGLRELIGNEGVALWDIGRDPALRGDPIVLKGHKVAGKARKIPFKDDESIRAMRAQVEEINAWIADADLWWDGDEAEDKVDLGNRFLRRIFNNGSFEEGGRFFGGFWQKTKSALRLERILLGEEAESMVALDFGQMAVRTAYSMVPAQPPSGDLYAVPGLENFRDEVKRILNALLAADEIPERFPQGSRGRIPKNRAFSDVYDRIAKHHPELVRLFGSRLSLKFMRIESELLIDILLRLKRLGVVALPIHDCLLVAESKAAIAKEVMEAACWDRLKVEGRVEISRRPIPAIASLLSEDTPTTTPTTVNLSAPLKRGA
jgi:hypothetical protein